MQYTVDIPDGLIAQAEAAAARINSRQAERDRAVLPIKVVPEDVRLVFVRHLAGIVVQDEQQAAQLDSERRLKDAQERLAGFEQAAPAPLTPEQPFP